MHDLITNYGSSDPNSFGTNAKLASDGGDTEARQSELDGIMDYRLRQWVRELQSTISLPFNP